MSATSKMTYELNGQTMSVDTAVCAAAGKRAWETLEAQIRESIHEEIEMQQGLSALKGTFKVEHEAMEEPHRRFFEINVTYESDQPEDSKGSRIGISKFELL